MFLRIGNHCDCNGLEMRDVFELWVIAFADIDCRTDYNSIDIKGDIYLVLFISIAHYNDMYSHI